VLHGALTIHGVTRHVDLVASVTRTGDTTHVTSRFPIDLTDYQISGLTKMFGLLRMEREVDVRVDLRFMDAPTLWAIP
jgi:polyisoprenoid-binding protein YceI